jgi:pimeloyl-ACP methyl ester carboxylesterase
MPAPIFPGAVEPERSRFVESLGLRVHVVEWGDPAAPPILLHHGYWDHARSFATLAPLLAARFRVAAMDASGHGESDWAGAYAWHTHVRDVVAVMRSFGAPLHLVGHSMGGGQVVDAARAAPELVRQVVNIDGFGPPPLTAEEQARTLERFAEHLDQRRGAAQRLDWRPYATLEQLVERRRAQNPRLSREWLRYFVYHGARESADGWRWKADPYLAFGFGPWRPEWIGPGYARLRAPLLAVIGSENDTWGPMPESIVAPRLAGVARLQRVTVDGAGHFVHIERPRETANALLDYLEH